MRCYNCGTVLLDADKFCPNCGVGIVEEKSESSRLIICPTCGDSFPEASLDSQGLSPDCPRCRFRRSADKKRQETRHARDMQRIINSDRADYRNQRKAARFEVTGCFVRISQVGLTAIILRKQPKLGPLIDLSTTGLQCEADTSYTKGEIVDIHLLVPAFNKPLNLKGEIMWSVCGREGNCRIGVRFDSTDDSTRHHLEALEKHEALRVASNLLEEKRSSAQIRAVPENKPKDRPADF